MESHAGVQVLFRRRQALSRQCSSGVKASEEFVCRVARQGVIQPIAVRPREEGGYWLVAGARRLRATRVEGTVWIPAVVRDLSERQSVAVAYVEHLRRDDLNATDEARSLVCLIEEFNLTHEDVANTLARSRAVMANTLRLLNLDSTLQRLVLETSSPDGPRAGAARS